MTRSLTLTAVALAVSFTLATAASAQQATFIQHPQPAIQPHPGPVFLPKFGFQSYNVQNLGERVTHVRYGGIASQLGLEPGDTILRLNGFPLTYHGAWNQALQHAMQQGGWVQLAIRDVRTGAVVHRQVSLGGGPGIGPITPKAYAGQPQPYVQPQPHLQPNPGWHPQPECEQPGGPITPKSASNHHHNNNRSAGLKLNVNSQSAKQLSKLLKIGE